MNRGEIFELSSQNSIANHFIAELRDEVLQKDSMRFRKNLERLGEILAYELSKSFPYLNKTIKTPLDNCEVGLIREMPVLLSILRASVPFFQGVLNFFDGADSGFIGAYRNHAKNDLEVSINLDYISIPSLENKSVVLIDPMLATGKSMIKTIGHLNDYGNFKELHLVVAIAARPGIDYVLSNCPVPVKIWCGAIDEELNDKSYIVPGLGDAGDLAYGNKI